MTGSPGVLYMLRIEIDGHFHGSGDVPKPWVARIDGPSPRFGLARTFIPVMNDWRDAKKAWSGNTYGVVATFPLRQGALYEASRLRGTSSRRHVAREFFWLENKKMRKMEPIDALATACGESDRAASILNLADDRDVPPSVALVEGLGAAKRLGFVVVDGDRKYRLLNEHLYEVRERDQDPRLVVASAGAFKTLSQQEAMQWLASKQSISA